jgi:hypothetical protein
MKLPEAFQYFYEGKSIGRNCWKYKAPINKNDWNWVTKMDNEDFHADDWLVVDGNATYRVIRKDGEYKWEINNGNI